MCDIHLCDKVIEKIFKMGPVGLLIVPEEHVIHLADCDECMKKLTSLILLSVEAPASEKVM